MTAIPADLAAWAAIAPPGACVEYHRGYLARARHELRMLLDRDEPVPPEIATACDRADDAWRLHERGLVHLVQRALAEGGHAYLAIRTHRPVTGRPGPAAQRGGVR